MEDSAIISYRSKIDSQFQVFVVYKDYEKYDIIKEMLERCNGSLAALQVNTTNIYIDGEAIEELSADQMLAIEAHEIAHYRLKHPAGLSEDLEIEADLFAISLLELDGYFEAANYLKDRLNEFYDIDFSEFDSEWNESENENFSF